MISNNSVQFGNGPKEGRGVKELNLFSVCTFGSASGATGVQEKGDILGLRDDTKLGGGRSADRNRPHRLQAQTWAQGAQFNPGLPYGHAELVRRLCRHCSSVAPGARNDQGLGLGVPQVELELVQLRCRIRPRGVREEREKRRGALPCNQG